jgi:ribosomal protein L37AE/L43A
MTKEEKAQRKTQREAQKARIEKAQAEARTIVVTGVCPQCGKPLRRNLSLSGWWQCEQFGAVGWRKSSELPPCSFQCFTE